MALEIAVDGGSGGGGGCRGLRDSRMFGAPLTKMARSH